MPFIGGSGLTDHVKAAKPMLMTSWKMMALVEGRRNLKLNPNSDSGSSLCSFRRLSQAQSNRGEPGVSLHRRTLGMSLAVSPFSRKYSLILP